MSDENKTEQVEATATENVEAKQEEPKKEYTNNKGMQVDIDKVVGERLSRRERQIAEELGVQSLDEAKQVIEERKKAEEEKCPSPSSRTSLCGTAPSPSANLRCSSRFHFR